MRRDATDGDGEARFIELADTGSEEESCGPQTGWETAFSLLTEEGATHPPPLPSPRCPMQRARAQLSASPHT